MSNRKAITGAGGGEASCVDTLTIYQDRLYIYAVGKWYSLDNVVGIVRLIQAHPDVQTRLNELTGQ